ncbi:MULTISPECIES: hypothetical protein [Maribacter]|uniref:Uncharacterized protein n=1 Tax=Maribacter flavus TaxID=1658664 RepID=A0ABU7IFB2_9FLAO|nr:MULTISPECIES: hypothetical protein [Maribacter]MDC6404501.1 hypothetical protein [Maribacter sp. PR66]MEE1971645.1 hypothetical protein [Maribacter flavus]
MKKYLILCFITVGLLGNTQAMPIQNNMDVQNVSISDDFEKIPSSELTPAVVEEILKEYPTSKLGAAYRNSKGIFKLVMVLKSGTRRTVYINPYGNWITNKK